MSKLTKYKFNSLYDMSSGISSSKEQAGHGYPFVSFSTIFQNYFLPSTIVDLMNTSEKDRVNYSIKKDDILITRTSETIDELAMSCVVLSDYPNTTYSGFAKRLRPKTNTKNIVYSKYIAFYLRSELFRKSVTNNAFMTLRASFNEDIFSFLDLFLPTYDKQKKVGDLLYSIDQKIQNNKKIISEVEDMAKALYDYWFTQFDFPDANGKPYKSSGGAMVFNEELKREIPQGWEVKPLNQLLKKNTEAFDYSKPLPTVDLSIMESGTFCLDKLNSSSNFSTNLFVMNEGDILFGSIRPYLKKAGIAPCNGVVTGTVHSFIPFNKDDYNFTLLTLTRDTFFGFAVKVSTGTKMPVISSENLLSYKTAYSKNVAKQFSEIEIKKAICSKINENQQLTELRDWLLPMLINGQVTVE